MILSYRAKVLGLCGPKQSGKTTLQELLIKSNPRFIGFNFADPIKEMLRALMESQGVEFAEICEMLWGSIREYPSDYLEGRTPRWAMQSLGTEWGRRLIGPDLWINTWRRQVLRHMPQTIVVAADLRFLNEAQVVHELGGYVVRVERDGSGPSNHISEQEYLKIQPDLVITNNTTPDDMLIQLQSLLEE